MFSPDEKNNNEMSMEDILASIRKYVSEEDIQMADKENSDVINKEDSSRYGEENVIKLDESQVVINENMEQNKNEIEEKAFMEEEKKDNPFNKLATAFKEYGKSNNRNHDSSNKLDIGSLTINGFLIEIATPLIKEWISQNMDKMVEEIVNREIEKLKNQ